MVNTTDRQQSVTAAVGLTEAERDRGKTLAKKTHVELEGNVVNASAL